MSDTETASGSEPFLVVEDTAEPSNLTPIYSVAKECTPVRGNLTCSGTNEFCFLCAYCSTAECEVDLRAHIHELATQGQEVCTIARAVHSIYNTSIRDTLVHTTDDGSVIERPEWTLHSIRRHLLLSGEYSSIFKTYEEFLYKSIIGTFWGWLKLRTISFSPAIHSAPGRRDCKRVWECRRNQNKGPFGLTEKL